MIKAQIEAKRFGEWLEKYHHGKGYAHLGEALLEWCSADGGALRLTDYGQFLQMVIAILANGQRSLPVRVDAPANKYMRIPVPTSFEGWLPDMDDFKAAANEAKMYAVEPQC